MNRIPYLLILLGVVADQLLKLWASSTLSLYKPIVVFPNILDLHLVHNYGAAYGILQGQRLLLLCIGITVVCAFFVFYRHIVTSYWSRLGFIFFMGGAIGNIVDRLRLGYVVDYINIHIFPVFNLADVLIDIGIVCFIVDIFASGSFSRTKK